MTDNRWEARKRPKPVKPRLDSLILVLTILAIAAVGLAAGVGIWKLSASSPGSQPEKSDLPGFVYDPAAPADTPKATGQP